MTFEKYHKIKILGDEDNEGILTKGDDIVIEEKIDGANFRFMFKEGRIIFGSRNQSIGDDTEEIGGNWNRCVEFIKKKLEEGRFKEDPHILAQTIIFYGECCVRHSMDYDWTKIPPFLGFDIKIFYDDGESEYLDYKEKQDLFGFFSLPMVPLVKIVKAEEIKELTDKDVPNSFYVSPSAKDKQAEGIVIKNYTRQKFAKYVRDKFKEVARDTFGSGKRWATNDNERIVSMYCTNPRIDKMIFKLIDEGNKLEMKLMQHLPKRIYKDIWEEHYQDLLNSRWTVNFDLLRKQITKRCLAVLKQVIVNNAR